MLRWWVLPQRVRKEHPRFELISTVLRVLTLIQTSGADVMRLSHNSDRDVRLTAGPSVKGKAVCQLLPNVLWLAKSL